MMYQSLNFLMFCFIKILLKKHSHINISPALGMQILMLNEGKSVPMAIVRVSDRLRTGDQIHLTPIPCS